jgi:hypothetical protein
MQCNLDPVTLFLCIPPASPRLKVALRQGTPSGRGRVAQWLDHCSGMRIILSRVLILIYATWNEPTDGIYTRKKLCDNRFIG